MRQGWSYLLVALLALAPLSPARAEPDGGLSRVLEQARAAVQRVRGLPFLRDVPVETPSPEDGRRLLDRLIARELPESVARGQERILEGLQLLPAGYALREELEAILGEQALGLYDGERGVMVVFAGSGVAAELPSATVLIHEYDHALVDQHFGFERRRGVVDGPGREDRHFAWLALAEGDAVLTMLIATSPGGDPDVENFLRGLEERPLEGAPRLAEAPAWIRTLLLEPYRLGTRLVTDAWQRDGWEGVERLWRRPPLSSEQLLHADRRGDVPTELQAPPPPAGWRQAARLQLGELGIAAWLGVHLDRSRAAAAAAGWDGDLVELLEADDERSGSSRSGKRLGDLRPGGTGPEPSVGAGHTRPGTGSGSGKAYRTGVGSAPAAAVEQRLRILTTWDTAADAGEFSEAVMAWLDQGAETVAHWTLRQTGRGVEIGIELAPSPVGEVELLDEDPWSGVEFSGNSGGEHL